VQQVNIIAKLFAQGLEQSRNMGKIFFRRPEVLNRQTCFRWFVKHFIRGNAVSAGQAGYANLGAHRTVTSFQVAANFADNFGDVAAIGVSIDQYAGAALAAKQVI
jgi:hypothetical protein